MNTRLGSCVYRYTGRQGLGEGRGGTGKRSVQYIVVIIDIDTRSSVDPRCSGYGCPCTQDRVGAKGRGAEDAEAPQYIVPVYKNIDNDIQDVGLRCM